MAQLLIRNLDDEVVTRLKQRAKANHRSLQAEVQRILEQVARAEADGFWQEANQVRERLARYDTDFSNSAELIREDRDTR